MGRLLGALTTSVPLAQSVVKLEALACRRAVQFAMEIGLIEVIFEGTFDFSAYGHIIEDICSQAAAFQFSVFCHVSHNCNIVADALAKKS